MLSLHAFVGTDRGLVRPCNEDAFLLEVPHDENTRQRKGLLAIVADGVGGAAGGDKASQIAVAMIREHYFQNPESDVARSLQEALRAANGAILKAAQSDPRYRGMATTCTALVIKDGTGCIAHIGDSRAYVLRQGTLQQITQDHTLVNALVARGILSPEEAKNHPQKNIIVKALGTQPHVDPDIYHIQVVEKDSILLCSDGLYGLVLEREIASILRKHSAKESGNTLIELAKKNGGGDNITLIILELTQYNKSLENNKPTKTKNFMTPREKHKVRFSWLSCLISILLLGAALYYITHQ